MRHTQLLCNLAFRGFALAAMFAAFSFASADPPPQGGGQPPVITFFDWRDLGNGLLLVGHVQDESPAACAIYLTGGHNGMAQIAANGDFSCTVEGLSDTIVTAQAVDIDFNESDPVSINVPAF